MDMRASSCHHRCGCARNAAMVHHALCGVAWISALPQFKALHLLLCTVLTPSPNRRRLHLALPMLSITSFFLDPAGSIASQPPLHASDEHTMCNLQLCMSRLSLVKSMCTAPLHRTQQRCLHC